MIDFTSEQKRIDTKIENFVLQISRVRTGRAHASLVEHVLIDSYGVKTPLPHMAAISSPDAKSIVITPWDKSAIGSIEKALRSADLGFGIVSDKDAVRLSVPALTEERRKECVKRVKEIAEEVRIAIRAIREDIWRTLQDGARDGTISEDQKFSDKEKMEKMVEVTNKKIAEISFKKEEEIMTI
jgi:ribosome recycling factor